MLAERLLHARQRLDAVRSRQKTTQAKAESQRQAQQHHDHPCYSSIARDFSERRRARCNGHTIDKYGDGLEGIAHRSTLTKETQHVLAHASNLLQEHTRTALMSVGASNQPDVRYKFGLVGGASTGSQWEV